MIIITCTLFMSLLIIQTPIIISITILLLALFLGLQTQTLFFSWFRYIIFLLYVGGILVVFIYFSSLIPNQKLPTPLILLVSLSAFIVLSYSPDYQISSLNSTINLRENTVLFSNSNLILRLILILFLLILLLIVVKITNNSKRPLRPIA